MHKSKLIQIMSTLTSSEMGRFDRYVHSSYFTVHQDTIIFFDLLKEIYPDFEEEKVLPEKIYAKIYPNTPYNDGRLRTLRKYLLKLLLGFLAQTQMEEQEWEIKRYEMGSLFSRGLDKYFFKHLEEAQSNLDAFPHQNVEYFLHRFKLQNLKVDYQAIYSGRFTAKDQIQALQALDSFYISSKLRLVSSIITEQGLLNSKDVKGISMFMEIMEYCSTHLEEMPTLVRAYFHIIQIGSSEQHQHHYEKIKEMFPEIFQSLTKDDLGNICIPMINYCNTQYQKGKGEFLPEMFEIYKKMLEHNVLFDEAMLSSHHYKNITTLGLRLGEFEWTEGFIETNKHMIESQYQEGVYNYNLANLYGYKKDFGKALKHLQQVAFLDPYYKISYDLLLMKIYYECSEVEAFLALCTSFQTFIRRKKELTGFRKDAYLNFIKFSKNLFNIKVNGKKNLSKVKQSIETAESLREKSWLIEKVQELS